MASAGRRGDETEKKSLRTDFSGKVFKAENSSETFESNKTKLLSQSQTRSRFIKQALTFLVSVQLFHKQTCRASTHLMPHRTPYANSPLSDTCRNSEEIYGDDKFYLSYKKNLWNLSFLKSVSDLRTTSNVCLAGHLHKSKLFNFKN